MRTPSLLNFLAGTSAAAGATLLTAIPASKQVGIDAMKLVVSSVPWFALATMLAYAASIVEANQREVDVLVTPDLTPKEIDELRRRALSRIRRKLLFCDIGSCVSLAVGILLLLYFY